MNTMLYLLCLLSLALLFQPVVAFEFSGPFPDRDSMLSTYQNQVIHLPCTHMIDVAFL